MAENRIARNVLYSSIETPSVTRASGNLSSSAPLRNAALKPPYSASTFWSPVLSAMPILWISCCNVRPWLYSMGAVADHIFSTRSVRSMGACSAAIPITVKDAAQFLGVSPSLVYAYVERRQIPHYRMMGRSIRFRLSELVEWRQQFHVNGGIDEQQDR